MVERHHERMPGDIAVFAGSRQSFVHDPRVAFPVLELCFIQPKTAAGGVIDQ